jgi:prophage regulatory protein
MSEPKEGRRILRRPVVEERSGLSRFTIWREENAGRFPKRVQITPGSIGWFADEFEEWLESRPRASEARAA